MDSCDPLAEGSTNSVALAAPNVWSGGRSQLPLNIGAQA